MYSNTYFSKYSTISLYINFSQIRPISLHKLTVFQVPTSGQELYLLRFQFPHALHFIFQISDQNKSFDLAIVLLTLIEELSTVFSEIYSKNTVCFIKIIDHICQSRLPTDSGCVFRILKCSACSVVRLVIIIFELKISVIFHCHKAELTNFIFLCNSYSMSVFLNMFREYPS